MSREVVVKTVGVEFGEGNNVTRIQRTVDDLEEYTVRVERNGEPYSEYECDDFFVYADIYREECENMRRWLESKPKQKELEL